jgi:hypothetical protein
MTFDAAGEIERGELSAQVKATERARVLSRVKAVSVRIERRDLRAWLADPLPFLLVLYDVWADRAYWTIVQDQVGTNPALSAPVPDGCRYGCLWITY